jgi:multisubunit Na+/H+ antiporter MnhE subunit
MMFYVLVVAGLTLTFGFALASLAWQDMLMGSVLSILLLLAYRKSILPAYKPETEFVVHLLVRVPVFTWYLAGDILKGTWQVAMYVVGIRKLEHPGIVKVPFGNHSDSAVGFVGHLITVSPGSFVVDIDWDDRTMLVHYIDASEPDKLRQSVDKYYRLWEYGSHMPISKATPETKSLRGEER